MTKILKIDVWGAAHPVVFRDVEFVGVDAKGNVVGRWPINAMNTAAVLERLK